MSPNFRLAKHRLVLVALSLFAFACKPASGTVEGTITVQGAGNPADALVSAAGRVTSVAADGKYSIADVPAGAVTVRVTLEGYDAQEQQVTVEGGKTATANFTLSRGSGANRAPVLSALSASPSQLSRGGTASVKATATDPDGDALTYTWTATGGFTVAGGANGTATLTAPPTGGASGSVKVVVDDGKGGTATGEVLVSTSQNSSPLLASLTATPPTVARGGTVTLNASASDPEGDTLTYTWTAPAGWTLTPSGASATAIAPTTGGVTGTFQLQVSDGNGGTAHGAVVVSTAANGAPVLTSITATPPSVQKGGAISLQASATDPDGEALTYAWTVPAGWTLSGTGSTVTVTSPATPAASAVIEVQVGDTSGSSTRGSVVVSTRPNTNPQVASITATPNPAPRSANITLHVSASDPDGDALSYAWNAPAGWALAGSGATVTVTAPATSGQQATVGVVVTDGFGGTIGGSIIISTAPNGAPQLVSLSAAPNPVLKGGAMTLNASASDPEGDSLTYTWTPPAGWTLSGSGPNVALIAPPTPGASGAVSLQVSDGFGGSTTGSVTVSTSQNSVPLISSLTASPVPVIRSGMVTVSAAASDADGDALTYTWSPPSGWTLTGSGADVTLIAPATSGVTGSLSLEVSDAFGGTATASVVVATSANGRPQLASLSATPNPAPRGATVTVSASASDPDGDALSYVWSVNNPAWTLNPNGAQATLVAPSAPGSSASVLVQVTDGFGGVVSGTVTVSTPANFVPIILGLQGTPNPVLPGASMIADANASDFDGDPLSYAWNATPPSWVRTGSGASVSFRAPFTNNVSAAIDVTVSDGFGGQASRSMTVATSSCPANTMNCDGSTANGCETSLGSDSNNCGACGNICPAANPYCVQGVCSTQLRWVGVRNDVPVSEITGGGWTQCHVSDYNTFTALSSITSSCDKANLMLACRPTGSSILRVVAHAPRTDVLFDTGTGDVTHDANGVAWYFNNSWSWGFAPEGVAVRRFSCDTNESSIGTPPGATANQRLCNHTSSDFVSQGWRCGNQDSLFTPTWERLVFHAD